MRRMILALAATTVMATFAHAQSAAPAPAEPVPTQMAPATTTPAATVPMTTSEIFVVAKPTDVLSYNLVGLNIMNPANESIGEIKDLIISQGELSGYVVSVGGFLGMGEKYVIVSPDSVSVVYSETDKKWSARMDTTKDALKEAPEFKYEGPWAS